MALLSPGKVNPPPHHLPSRITPLPQHTKNRNLSGSYSRARYYNICGKYLVNHHHNKHPGLGHLFRSVSRVTAALSIASSVYQLFSFLVGCRGMISRGFGFVAFFVCVRASSFCIHLSCLVFSLSVVRGEWICLFCSHRRCSLPEVSVASFLPPQFFVSVRLSKSSFRTHLVNR